MIAIIEKDEKDGAGYFITYYNGEEKYGYSLVSGYHEQPLKEAVRTARFYGSKSVRITFED